MNEKLVWSNFITVIKNEITSLSFETWFKDTELYELKNGKAIILVPMPIHKKHLTDNYLQVIKDNLKEIAGDDYEIEFLLKEELVSLFSNIIFFNRGVNTTFPS